MAESASASGSTERHREDDLGSGLVEKVHGSEIVRNDDGGGWETCDSDSDGSIPDPDEIMRMPDSGPLFDWKRISKVVRGPLCWKCFVFSPYFRCENCSRSFHRECVFMEDGFPDPIFDKSVEDAYKANYKEVKLVKCAICVITEQTQILALSNMSREELNKVFFLIAQYTHVEFGIDILPKIQTKGITTADIMEKASRGGYKTIEGFYNDYKWLQYVLVKKYAVESEENDVAKTVLNTVKLYVHVMIACVDCVTKFFDSEGRPHKAKEFTWVVRNPCTEPHAILWVKEGTFPFWPAIVLAHDTVNNTILIRFFGERAVGKLFPYPTDGMVFRTYSSVFPDRKPKKLENKWVQGCTECNGYIKNLKELHGNEGVIIPQNSELFNGDLENYKRAMFPLFVFKDTETGDVPDALEA